MRDFIKKEILNQINVLQAIHQDADLHTVVEQIATSCIAALKNGSKILFAGNGGSAADAQHLAAELVGRLRYHRPGLAGIALTTDTSALTAIGNDYEFDHIFARQIEALGREGDVFIGISTSGKSPNILKACQAARDLGMVTVGFTGANAPKLTEQCDHVLHVPAQETSKIQENHILFGHIICGLIEDTIFGAEYDPQYKLA